MPFVQIYHGGFQIFGGQPQPSIIVNNAIYDGYKSLMFPHIVVQPVGNMYNPLLDGWMIKKNKLILIGEIPNAPILRVPNIPVCDVCIPRCKHHLRIYPSIYSHHKFSQLTRITSIVWILVTIPGTYHSAILNITVKKCIHAEVKPAISTSRWEKTTYVDYNHYHLPDWRILLHDGLAHICRHRMHGQLKECLTPGDLQ